MSIEPQLYVLHCNECGQQIAAIQRPAEFVRTMRDIFRIRVDGIAVWCKRCGIATEYVFQEEVPAEDVA